MLPRDLSGSKAGYFSSGLGESYWSTGLTYLFFISLHYFRVFAQKEAAAPPVPFGRAALALGRAMPKASGDLPFLNANISRPSALQPASPMFTHRAEIPPAISVEQLERK